MKHFKADGDDDGMPWRLFITELSRWKDSPAWQELPRWWRYQLAMRMIDARDAEERSRIYELGVMLRELQQAVENLVTVNEGAMDGRRSRFNSSRTAGKAGADRKAGARRPAKRAGSGDSGAAAAVDQRGAR